MISVPSPTPCPHGDVCGHSIFLSGGRTRGEVVGKLTWLLVTPLSGGISQPLSVHREKAQLTKRESPHLEVCGSPEASSLCGLRIAFYIRKDLGVRRRVWKEVGACGKRLVLRVKLQPVGFRRGPRLSASPAGHLCELGSAHACPWSPPGTLTHLDSRLVRGVHS